MSRNPIVSQIVNRLHVSTSYLQVCRELVSCLNRGYRTYVSLPRDHRRSLLRDAMEQHHDNRKLYQSVMSGSF